MSNQELANLLRSVATALTLKKANQFQIRAYENASDAIEHSTSEIKDLWEEGKLDEVPGLGEKLVAHLSELFKIGHVRHFESVMRGIDPVVFELIKVPGIGPKNAQELAKLGVKSVADLEDKIYSGELAKKGFSTKIAEKFSMGVEEYKGLGTRMLLPYATAQAEKVIDYLKKCPEVEAADSLGSLRRQVATVGDLDFAASSEQVAKVVDWFVKMPGVREVVNQGENKATVVLSSGLHVDLLVGHPSSYGALLQHFTGSKQHNIKLREYAQGKGLSLSEHGVKKVSRVKSRESRAEIVETKKEYDFYRLLGMQTPPPEIREDTGEIEAAIKHQLPKLVELEDIKGDVHLHSSFPLEPSHGPGANSMEEIVKKAKELGYIYVGLSDHPPGFTTHSKEQIIEMIKKRTKHIEQIKSSSKIHVLNGLEIDILPNGTLSIPNEALETLDYCIAGIHSVHKMSRDEMTKRLIVALENPSIDIISHPTGRLLNERASFEAEWEEIFKICGRLNKILEINAYPNRLDLRDDLVREAIRAGVKLVINSDAHEISQMDNMRFGVSVARRGWVTKNEVVNSWDWKKFSKWFNIKT